MQHSVYEGPGSGQSHFVEEADLAAIVAGFEPQKIGLAPAWNEFYLACLAAGAEPSLLQAIHDIKESIEDAQAEIAK